MRSSYAGCTTWTAHNPFTIFGVGFATVAGYSVIHAVVLPHNNGIVTVVGMNAIAITSTSNITVSITHASSRIST
jgi:hypothetical protein